MRRQIGTGGQHKALQPAPHLHKVAADERLSDVCVVVLAGKLGAHAREANAVDNADELRSHVVGRLEGAVLDKVLPAPVCVAVALLVRVVDVEQGQVVAISVSKALGKEGGGEGNAG